MSEHRAVKRLVFGLLVRVTSWVGLMGPVKVYLPPYGPNAPHCWRLRRRHW